MIERNEEPYYLIHAGNAGEERFWSPDLDEALEFFSSKSAEAFCDKGTIVRIGNEDEFNTEYDDEDDWL